MPLATEAIPPDFVRLSHRSPLTDPWEPIYWKHGADDSRLGLRLREAHCNSRGFAHGGLISALADNAMGLFIRAQQAAAGGTSLGVTIQLNVGYLGQARIGEWLEFQPRLLRLGRSLAFADCLVHSGPQLVARADASYRLTAPKPPDRSSAMARRSMAEDDPLDDFERRTTTIDGITKTVYRSGQGPAVIVMSEMPGISPQVARFARWVRDAGFTVYMPSLFGRDGAVPAVDEGIAVLQRACVSAEFRALAANESSPVTRWLRALARLAHQECGGPGVGAIGMCFTGNFALTMMLEPAMLAPVLCQPSIPRNDPAGLEISPEDLALVKNRLDRENLTVMAYRFQGDRFCKAERFAAYARALGDRFVPRVLPDSAANRDDLSPFFEHVVASPHSVMTQHLIDKAGEPTIAARDEVISFFTQRLKPERPRTV